MSDHIPLDQCEDRRVYRLHSRNLTLGVYVAADKGFIGIRTKFGDRFLDMEYHYDTGAPFGTAKPQYATPTTVPAPVRLELNFAQAYCVFCGLPVLQWEGPVRWRHGFAHDISRIAFDADHDVMPRHMSNDRLFTMLALTPDDKETP